MTEKKLNQTDAHIISTMEEQPFQSVAFNQWQTKMAYKKCSLSLSFSLSLESFLYISNKLVL